MALRQNISGKDLDGYSITVRSATGSLQSGYWQRAREKNVVGIIPLTVQGWQLSGLYVGQFVAMITVRPNRPPNDPGHKFYSTETVPALARFASVDDIARHLRLGKIVDSQVCPFPPPPIPTQLDEVIVGEEMAAQAAAELESYKKQVEQWGWDWGAQLAEKHIRSLPTDFGAAKDMMLEAYGALFDLEMSLRQYVKNGLEGRFGSDWWARANIADEIRKHAAIRQSDGSGYWLDDLDYSVFRLLDFADLHAIIGANKDAFRAGLGPDQSSAEELLDALAALTPFRYRVGRFNALSEDELQSLRGESEKIVKVIRAAL